MSNVYEADLEGTRLDIGPHRPLGYMALTEMEKAGLSPARALATLTERRKLARIFTQAQCNVVSGALFAGCPEALADFTETHRAVLLKNFVPTQPWQFMMFAGEALFHPRARRWNSELAKVMDLAFAFSGKNLP